MTEIKIKKAPFERGLYAYGHCGFSSKGNDIVCASVSSLICTLSLFVNNQDKQGKLSDIINNLAEGKANIFFRSNSSEYLHIFDAFCDGLFLIEKMYPCNLKITVDGKE